jgi:hypothetical protein
MEAELFTNKYALRMWIGFVWLRRGSGSVAILNMVMKLRVP